MSGVHPVAIARPQVGIERLPARRMSNEPRESMNCKSCRKRKIKCNRLRPACEACQVFQCPCIYDAVPKKRGPKTDVLDALLKRVDGLEAQLREKNAEQTSPTSSSENRDPKTTEAAQIEPEGPASKRVATDQRIVLDAVDDTQISPTEPMCREPSPPPVQPEVLLDTYFARLHSKPYHIVDETSVRQRMQLGQLPEFLKHAIFAVASRYTAHPGGYQSAVNLSDEYAALSRKEIDTDDPSIDSLQASLLLVIAFIGSGKGKKAFMLLTTAVGTATALEIHREPEHTNAAPIEREMRRRLFWSCYLLDRFMACGSKRPSFINDKTIMLRLPSWMPNQSAGYIEGEFFQPGSNLQQFQGTGKKYQGSSGMLIDITRILGTTNEYLAAGGVRGDSHFPWHSLSNLSKIRQDLDVWASGTDDVFSSLETLFGQTDSTILVLSKLIYHLIHCLIYRPFLPIDLAELAGNGQHESWQIEATNMCFLHANAIAELIELGRQTSTIEWPAFVGYCICTAGTVHTHGAQYSKQGGLGEMNVFGSSAHFLAREMQHLSELRYAWASVQHHRETLQGIYNAHAELVKSLTGSSMRYTPSLHLEDFFERYSNIEGADGQFFQFDAANLSLSDALVDFTADTYSGHDLYAPRGSDETERPGLKRKNTASSTRTRPDLNSITVLDSAPPATSATLNFARGPGFQNHSSAALATSTALNQNQESMDMSESAVKHTAVAVATAAGLDVSQHQNSQVNQGLQSMSGGLFNSGYNYGAGLGSHQHDQNIMGESSGFDPMFGTLPTNAFGSPAAWQTDEGQNRVGPSTAAVGGGPAPNPEPASNDASPAIQSDEKDPFLTLLEQLAENEQRINNGGSTELDFFLTGSATS